MAGGEMQLEQEIAAAEETLMAARQNLADLRRQRPLEKFEDHVLTSYEVGEVRLSELFGKKRDLLIVHNMGENCPYCTMWADGLDGVLDHLLSRTGFAVVSPDPPDAQAEFLRKRQWRFRLLSNHGGEFTKAAGFETDDGSPMPGVSAFRMTEEGDIFRVGRSFFGPHDDFCAVWHLFDLLQDGAAGWQPKFSY